MRGSNLRRGLRSSLCCTSCNKVDRRKHERLDGHPTGAPVPATHQLTRAFYFERAVSSACLVAEQWLIRLRFTTPRQGVKTARQSLAPHLRLKIYVHLCQSMAEKLMVEPRSPINREQASNQKRTPRPGCAIDFAAVSSAFLPGQDWLFFVVIRRSILRMFLLVLMLIGRLPIFWIFLDHLCVMVLWGVVPIHPH